ncbi:MAG: alpha/beta hydrolase, partial [Clostridiales bacterium]|nr:alpha/beta hydrolase [Clostridiales bacterium]
VLYHIMSNRYPGLPYFLLGHSMGSFLSRIYASLFGDELSGLIACGTAQIGGAASSLSEFTDTVADLIGREKFSSRGSDALGKITSHYYKENDDSSWLSLSQENRIEAESDPYFDFPITNASAMNLAKMLFKCSSDECITSTPQSLPIYLLSGGKDPIGFFGRGVISLCEKLENNGNDVQIQIYPGLRHEILNEDDYEHIYKDILNWCVSSLQKGYQADFI